MKVGHSDVCPLPQFQWTNQGWGKPPPTTASSTTATVAASTNSGGGCDASSSLPCSRVLHACCVLGHHVYLFGGKNRYMPLKDLWRLDLENGKWEPMVFQDTKMPHLQGHSMVAYRSQVFIFGGSFGENPDDTPLWIYSPDLNHVREYCCEPLQPHPVGRREHTAVVYKNCMYIYGGFLDSSGSTDDLWTFNLEDEEWISLPRPKEGKRHGHVCVVYQNTMWVHGGVRGFDCLADLWVYNFDLFTWTRLKGIGKSPALSSHTAHVIEDSIVLVGGSSRKSSLSSSIWIYGIGNNTWHQVDVDQSHLFSPVFLHTAVLVDPKAILLTNAQDQSSQSTPHLKSHLVEAVPPSARPWTSPSIADTSNQSLFPSSFVDSTSEVNVLTLHSDIDGNSFTDKNNNSEENLFSCMELTPKHTSSENFEMKELISGAKSGRVCVNLQPSNPALTRIRPSSSEHCHDDLPLLERFQSVGSDVDLGESNAVITLSDENICDETQSVNDSSQCDKKDCFQYDNPAFLPVIAPNNSNIVDSQSNDSNFQRAVVISSNSNNSLPLSHSQSISQPADNDATIKLNCNRYLFEHSQCDCSLCLNESITTSNDEENFHNLFNDLGSRELETCKSFNDLILEDLESCSSESFALADLTLVSPSTSGNKSSSLKEVSSLSSPVHDQYFFQSHPFYVNSPRKNLSKSCSSLTIVFNEINSVSDSSSSKTMEDRTRRNSSCTTAEKTSGKYIKHQRSVLKNGMHLDKRRQSSQSNLQKMITLKKSAATQTSESQTSLTGAHPKGIIQEERSPCKTEERNSIKLPLSKLSQGNTECGLNVFSDCKLVLLVLGGEMEMPTFTKAPIHIWKCKIF